MQGTGRYVGIMVICPLARLRPLFVGVQYGCHYFRVLAAAPGGSTMRVACHFFETKDESHCCVRDEQELPNQNQSTLVGPHGRGRAFLPPEAIRSGRLSTPNVPQQLPVNMTMNVCHCM